MKDKKFILKISVIVILILTLICVIIIKGRITKSVQEKSQDKVSKINTRISDDEILLKYPRGIDSIFFQYGLKKDWVKTTIEKYSFKDTASKQPSGKKKKTEVTITKPKKQEKFLFTKEINVPPDVSIADINIDINNFLDSGGLSLSASEIHQSGNVVSKIYRNNDSVKVAVAILNFVPVKDLKRDAAEICVILSNLDKLPEADLDKILNSSEKFSVVLPYDIEKSEIQAKVFDAKRDYVLIYDIGSEKDVDADFRSDMKQKEWKSKVQSMSFEYNKASGILLSARRSLPSFYSDLFQEFSRYNKNIYSDTIFVKYETTEKAEKKIELIVTDIKNKTARGYKNIFYLVEFSSEDFDLYQKEIPELKRKGFKFKTFGEINKLK
jgi:hypothetical protein